MANFLKIRDLCKSKNITIRELSNRVGIGEGALQALIKSGSTNTITLEKISNELGVNPSVFFEKQDKSIGDINIKNATNFTVDDDSFKEKYYVLLEENRELRIEIENLKKIIAAQKIVVPEINR